MTPAARLAAAAEILDEIAGSRAPAEAELKRWGQAHRFAGSKDRRAIADRVYRCLRARARLAWAMGREDGRALVLGSLALVDGAELLEIETLFSGEGYAPPPLTADERARLEARPGEPPAWVAAGLPAFVAADLERVHGEAWIGEAEAVMRPRAPIDLRVNGAKADVDAVIAELAAEGLTATRTPFSAWGLRLDAEPPPNIQKLAAFREGRIEIQDEGSQIVSWLAGAQAGTTVVDYCAGGGGKTLALAQSLNSTAPLSNLPSSSGPQRTKSGAEPEDPAVPGSTLGSARREDKAALAGSSGSPPEQVRGRPEDDGQEEGDERENRIVALDVDQRRLDAIRPRLARAGVVADLRKLGPAGEGVEDLVASADLVVVDAPCTGSGTWRRRPEEASRLTEAEVERLHALQLDILDRAASLVTPGGRLAYVTCSILSREDEAVADAFEAAHPGFRPVPVAETLSTPHLTDAAHASLSALSQANRLRLSPRSSGTDGFFLALYERMR